MEKDKDIYLKVEKEFDSSRRQEALWVKSLTLCEGDEKKAKYKYIELRVKEEKAKYVPSIAEYFHIDKEEGYILRLEQAGMNATNIRAFLASDGEVLAMFNKAGGGKPGLKALADSDIMYKKFQEIQETEADERLTFKEEYKKAMKESENDPFPDHWARKVFLVVYPAMFVGGFIEVLTEGVKDPFRFTFNAISDGGLSTIAFVAFIIGVIWTYMIYKDKESSK